MPIEKFRAWAATFRGARDAIEAAAAVAGRSDDLVEIDSAYRHARDVQRAARVELEAATWMTPDEVTERAKALTKGEALCDAALARLQTSIPYRSER